MQEMEARFQGREFQCCDVLPLRETTPGMQTGTFQIDDSQLSSHIPPHPRTDKHFC